MPPIFVDARDLAERLGVRYDTVLTWVRRGKIPHVRDGRGRLLFNLNTVLETLRQKSLDARHAAAGREVDMRPDSRRKPAVYDPGPVRLATPHPSDVGPIDPPEDPRPEAKRGPTLPAGFGRPPEAPATTPWPNAEQSNRRTLHLRAVESDPAKREAIQEAAVMENNTKTCSTHDPCYTIMQQGKPHRRNR